MKMAWRSTALQLIRARGLARLADSTILSCIDMAILEDRPTAPALRDDGDASPGNENGQLRARFASVAARVTIQTG